MASQGRGEYKLVLGVAMSFPQAQMNQVSRDEQADNPAGRGVSQSDCYRSPLQEYLTRSGFEALRKGVWI